MTDIDRQALDALMRLLQDEIVAIRRGDLGQVDAFAARKAELSATLEAAGPAIAEALAADPPDMALRGRIANLQELIETDKMLLERMTQATAAMLAEIIRIRDRHGLGGLYGEKGQPRAAEPVPLERLDRSV
ncbi:MAG: hypothetical protein NWQ32_05255 [Paracoccaceae bacterium]|jgi:flagellar biosynthesis/type III secretory pathway chaperone|nr:hypothetical protein [Paracoccaceae bacterium]MDP5347780.1 hypothetical protein [Paracoccaceae bacterium]